MDDLWRDDLHDDWEAKLGSELAGLLGRGGELSSWSIDADEGEDLGSLIGEQDLASVLSGTVEDLLDAVDLLLGEAAGVGEWLWIGWGSTNLSVVTDGLNGLDGWLWEVVVGDETRVKDLGWLDHGVATHEGGNDDLVWVLLLHLNAELSNFGLVGLGLWSDEDKAAVDVWILEADVNGVGISLGWGVTDDVNWVLDGSLGWENLSQLRLEVISHLSERDAIGFESIGSNDTWATSVGDDAEVSVFNWLKVLELSVLEQSREREQLVHGLGSDDAGLAESKVEGDIVASEGAGVRRSGSLTTAGSAGLQDDDGLLAAGLWDLLEEGLAVDDRLKVQKDDLGVLILANFLDQLDLVNVALVAEGDEVGEADVVREAPVKDGGQHSAGLGKEGDWALLWSLGGEGAVEGWSADTENVGADDSHVVLLADLDELLFHLDTLATDLLEAGCDDDDSADTLLAAVLSSSNAELGWDDEDGDLWSLGAGSDVWISLVAEDLWGLRIDRIDGTSISGLDDVVNDGVADLAWLARGTDDGDGLRISEET